MGKKVGSNSQWMILGLNVPLSRLSRRWRLVTSAEVTIVAKNVANVATEWATGSLQKYGISTNIWRHGSELRTWGNHRFTSLVLVLTNINHLIIGILKFDQEWHTWYNGAYGPPWSSAVKTSDNIWPAGPRSRHFPGRSGPPLGAGRSFWWLWFYPQKR